MNIQSISELNGLSAGIDELSVQNEHEHAFVEVSKQEPGQGSVVYNSYKLDLHVFLKSIVDMVSYLSAKIDNLNG